MFDTMSSTATVPEGGMASVCITISSTATSLGCDGDLTVTLTTADGKATSKFLCLFFNLLQTPHFWCP